MCLILPAFSSPDLKAFPLCSKSSKSSAGGQSWPLRAQRRDCVIYSAPLPLHSINPTDSPDTRISVGALVVLSDSLCLWRKDPYLPSRSLSVRHLRTNVLASYGICRQFPHPLSRTRKPPSNTIGQRNFLRLDIISSAPSSPVRRIILGLYQ